MSDLSDFRAFVAKVRAGDEQAATELVRRYEPLIRREVRLRLEDRRLTRLFDSMDVCQSVLASFFVRTAAGQYDLDNPDQLIKLLVVMTRNKLASAARRQHQQRRDQRKATGSADELDRAVSPDDSPSQIVSSRELFDRFRAAMSDEERKIAELRSEGLEWADVAARIGGQAQARRMQFARAVDRVAKSLGLDEGDHG